MIQVYRSEFPTISFVEPAKLYNSKKKEAYSVLKRHGDQAADLLFTLVPRRLVFKRETLIARKKSDKTYREFGPKLLASARRATLASEVWSRRRRLASSCDAATLTAAKSY